MKRILLLSLYLIASFWLQAQESADYYDVIYLKDGSEYRGQIIAFDPQQITIKWLGGHGQVFLRADIQKVIQEPINSSGKHKKPYEFKEQGIYKAIFASFTGGTAAWNDVFAKGIGMKGVVGYQWNRWMGTGLGFGVETYYPTQGEMLYPLFLELRGYFNESNASFYYSLASGYSFAIKNEEAGISDAKGGLLFHPALGLRLGGSANANFTIDVGVQLQKARFTRAYNNWRGIGTEMQEYKMFYQRIAIRLGMLF